MNPFFSSLGLLIYLNCSPIEEESPFHRAGSGKPGFRHLFPYFSRPELPISIITFWVSVAFAPSLLLLPPLHTSSNSVLPVSFLSTPVLVSSPCNGTQKGLHSAPPPSSNTLSFSFLFPEQKLLVKSLFSYSHSIISTTYANRNFLLFASDKEAPSGSHKYTLTC